MVGRSEAKLSTRTLRTPRFLLFPIAVKLHRRMIGYVAGSTQVFLEADSRNSATGAQVLGRNWLPHIGGGDTGKSHLP